ncbi:hypothetical protein INR49_018828 [Caranx melampygus]|nr:hypothetical protein INR49_018828 [Caranx melampygus]
MAAAATSEEVRQRPLGHSSSMNWLPPKSYIKLEESVGTENNNNNNNTWNGSIKFKYSSRSAERVMSELRVVLLGNSWSQRSSVGNFILGVKRFNTEEEPDCCQRQSGQWKEKEIVLINSPDLLHPNISEDQLTEFIKDCVSLSDPGPHVFLLVLQPEDFTEEQRLRLCRVLTLFSDQSFDRSLILISTPREEKPGFMEQFRRHPP